jgi:hypothetical protein
VGSLSISPAFSFLLLFFSRHTWTWLADHAIVRKKNSAATSYMGLQQQWIKVNGGGAAK